MVTQANNRCSRIVLLAAFVVFTHLGHGQDSVPTNLQVLPADTSSRELNAAMLENLSGLGLPRRQNEGCLYCHEGNMDVPSSQWDYASDAKLNKRKAREMMAMVRDINQRLSSLEQRTAPGFQVTCYSCHARRTDPRPLPDVLLSTYRESGIEATAQRYQELHARYFGGDAYDFRVGSLINVASAMVAQGQIDDAIAIARLNETTFTGSPDAVSFTLTLETARAIETDGLQSALSFLAEQRSTPRGSDIRWQVLDNLGWQFYRTDRQQLALELFRENQEQFPDDYIPNESLADALWFTEQSDAREESIAIFNAWLETNPDHAPAQRRLNTLLGQQ